MPITVTISDDLADQYKYYEAFLPEILQLGIREYQALRESGYNSMRSVLEKLAALPAPEEILALCPTPPLQERINKLLEKNRTTGLTPEDQRDWDQYRYVEHLVRLAKVNAARKLKVASVQSPRPD